MVRFCGFMDFRGRRPWREEDGFGVGQCKPGGWVFGRLSAAGKRKRGLTQRRKDAETQRNGLEKYVANGRGEGVATGWRSAPSQPWEGRSATGGECRLAYGWKIRPETGISRLWRQAVATPMDGRSATGGLVIVTRQDNPGGSVVFHVDAG